MWVWGLKDQRAGLKKVWGIMNSQMKKIKGKGHWHNEQQDKKGFEKQWTWTRWKV
jgi:hypothetical protein